MSLLPAPLRARLQKCLLLVVALASVSVAGLRSAAADPYVSTGLEAYPPNLQLKGGGAMMMLLASKDHTLFAPVYTDYEDLDGDRVLDNTFRKDFQYYGYFDSKKCYVYVAGYQAPNGLTGRFEPRKATGTAYSCTAAGNDASKYWSGNFLNWATMTRVDVVRKLLYGGFRRADTATDTTLEMAQMSKDAHSFVKFYGGADLSSYTPFDFPQGLTICNRGSINTEPDANNPGQPLMRLAKGNYSLWATIPSKEVCRFEGEGDAFAFGAKAGEFFKKFGTDVEGVLIPTNQAHGTNLPPASDSAFDVVGRELAVRVQACVTLASAPHAATTETCTSYGSGNKVVRKPVGLLQAYGTSAAVDQAAKAEFGLVTGSFDSPIEGGALRKNIGSLNDEVDPATGRFCYLWAATRTDPVPASCKVSTADAYADREAGIIATFDRIRLVGVGNYNQHIKQRASPPPDGNVVPTALINGDFPSWGNPISEMYVQALSFLANKQSGLALSATTQDDRLRLPRPAPLDPLNDTLLDKASGTARSSLYGHGICRKTLSLAISSSAVSYDTDDGGTGSLYGQFQSNFSSGEGAVTTRSLTGWTDRIGDEAQEDINNSPRSVGAVNGGFGTDCTIKTLGLGSVGSDGAYSAGLSKVSGVCPEAPAVKGSYLGAGAAFFARTTNLRADNELTPATGRGVDTKYLPLDALRVKSYAASLAGGVARIEVPIPGTSRFVVITPESIWKHQNLADLMPGAMLTFRSIGKLKPDLANGFGGSGSYVVTWNDAQFGGDYDMDLVGFIRWTLTRRTGSINQWVLSVQTDVFNNNAAAKGSHGFSIIGADAKVEGSEFSEDGKYITHGSNGFNATGDCATLSTGNSPVYSLYCGYGDGGAATVNYGSGSDGFAWPTKFGENKVGFDDDATAPRSSTVTKTFKVSSGLDASAVTLREPLWYMAKYGAFDTGEKVTTAWAERKSTDAVPGKLAAVGNRNFSNTNWDSLKNNGSICAGSNCGDGEPDGYFLARRPEQLASRLNDLLNREVAKSNTAVSVSSAQLVDGSYKYVATFNDTGDMRFGNVEAYLLDKDGVFPSEPTWNFGSFLTAASISGAARARAIITNTVVTDEDGNPTGAQVGVPFTTSLVDAGQSAYSAPYLAAMGGGTDAAAQIIATRLIAYMRGDRSGEGSNWRMRPEHNIMGQVVNSSPWIQDPAASARFTDGLFPAGTPSYTTFVANRVARNKVLWVGSNDGMLHGFGATTGQALLSYVPSPVVSRLAAAFTVSNGEATPLVDGSPFTADVLNTAGNNPVWRTYLFGNLGRGGKAVFALDVSDTGTSADVGGMSESASASLFKWVFTPDDDEDMGHVIATPVIHRTSGQAQQVVRLNNGRFGLLVPNGYQSANGRAVLYILFADGPGASGWSATGTARNFYKFMPLQSDANNGMAGVTWVDLNNDGTADVLYATDLQGKVWKVDVRSTDPADWGSAFLSAEGVAIPFFTAKGCTTSGTETTCGATAPITTNPVATLPKFGGVMVSFGTGRALSSGDFPGTALTNRFISVWDEGRYAEDQVFPSPTNPPEGFVAPLLPTLDTSEGRARFAEILLRRDNREGGSGSVYRVTRSEGGVESIVPSTTTDDVFDPATQDGWFFDFPSVGEQLISSPEAKAHFIAFTSVRPQSSSDLARSCLTDPLGTVYVINPSTGMAVPGAFSTETIDGVSFVVYGKSVLDQQIRVTGDRSNGKGTNPSAGCSAGRVKARFLGQVTDKDGCVAAANVRLQWRELNGMKTK